MFLPHNICHFQQGDSAAGEVAVWAIACSPWHRKTARLEHRFDPVDIDLDAALSSRVLPYFDCKIQAVTIRN
jgi:hypothetical protein